MKPIKKVALIHSLCSVGKASLTNMIPVLSTMGIEACPIPTMVLSTHTGGYGTPARQIINPEFIRETADHYRKNDVCFDIIFIGYLGSLEMITSIQYFIEQYPDACVVLDPILGDHGKLYSGLNSDYTKAYRQLFTQVDILLPNITELCLITETEYKEFFTNAELREICHIIHDSGVKTCIVTSISTENAKKSVALSTQEDMKMLEFHAENYQFHGTGDVFDAVFIGNYLSDQTMEQCILSAHQYVCKTMHESKTYSYPEREGLLIENTLRFLE